MLFKIFTFIALFFRVDQVTLDLRGLPETLDRQDPPDLQVSRVNVVHLDRPVLPVHPEIVVLPVQPVPQETVEIQVNLDTPDVTVLTESREHPELTDATEPRENEDTPEKTEA